MRISNYNNFLLEKEFNEILKDIFIITESEGKWTSDNTVEWDFEPSQPESKPDLVSRTVERLRNFISKLPKEKIKEYFIKLLNSLKKLPEKTRRYLIAHYTSVFLAVASLSYLVGYEDAPVKQTDMSNQTQEVSKPNQKLDSKIQQEIIEINNKASFEKAQSAVKEVEAGYSNDRDDTGNYIDVPGGKRFLGTNHGISAPILQKYFKDQGIKRLPTKEDMMNLSYETAKKIYKKDYWDAQSLSEFCDQNVANIVYDGCVNQGVEGMNEVLTKSLAEQGVKIKGSCFNKNNIKHINSCNQKELFNSIKKFREMRYKEASTWRIHGEGWMNRLHGIEYQNNNQV
jgi:lysozyme family protein